MLLQKSALWDNKGFTRLVSALRETPHRPIKTLGPLILTGRSDQDTIGTGHFASDWDVNNFARKC